MVVTQPGHEATYVMTDEDYENLYKPNPVRLSTEDLKSYETEIDLSPDHAQDKTITHEKS
jgi:hypothetical protein